MTALASTDVTVTVNSRDKDIGHGALSKFMGIATIVFGDGALTYPTGGVPLPAIGQFGLQRQVDIGLIEQPSGDGYVYKYDRTNHKIRIYQNVDPADTGGADTPLVEMGTGEAPAATTIKMVFIGE